jgi:hypothetical protein
MKHTPGPCETLARLALQSDRYQNDADFRDAVDAVLGHPVYEAAPALLEACEFLFTVLEDHGEKSGRAHAILFDAIRAAKGE